MASSPVRFIIPQLHDIRHRDAFGMLDIARMREAPLVLDLRVSQRGFITDTPRKRRVRVAVSEQERQAMRDAVSVSFRRWVVVPGVRHIEEEVLPQQPQEPPVSPKTALLPEEIIPVQETHTRKETKSVASMRPFAVAVFLVALIVPLLATAAGLATLERALTENASAAAASLDGAVSAMAALDVGAAQGAFSDAETQFRDAQRRLTSVGLGALSLLADLPFPSRLTSGKALLDAGQEMAAAGSDMSQAFAMVHLFSPDALLRVLASPGENQSAQQTMTKDTGATFSAYLQSAAAHLTVAADALERVNTRMVPESYRQRISDFQAALPVIRSGVETLQQSAQALSDILGMNGPRRYLILLENASELRPTGGFIGNVAIATVHNGRLEDLRIEDSYLFDGQLVRYTVPPKPVQDISAAWSLHDANWFRDFPTTARIASGFFEQTGGLTPDGVIAVSSSAIERLLAVSGPVQLPDGTSVDAQSFTDTLNAIGAAQRPGETTQVRAVAALLPALLHRLPETAVKNDANQGVVSALQQGILANDIMVWFRDAEAEKLSQRFGMSGEVPEARGDFLGVVLANINGFKTDHVIQDTLQHDATITGDGSIIDTVTLTRQHHGNERQEAFYRKVNKTYLRFLVPNGSELVSAEGITCDAYTPPVDYQAQGYSTEPQVVALEAASHVSAVNPCVDVGEESGKTSFGAWTFVSPGETLTVRFTYRLPTNLSGSPDSYRLFVLKQPGSEPMFTETLTVDPAWRIAWHDDLFRSAQNGALATLAEPLTRNRFFGAVLTR